MALRLALQVLFAVATALASRDLVPEPCLQGPDFWCQDVATAVQCRREQYCRNLPGAFLLWDQLDDEGEAPAPSKKCVICTKVMEQLKSMLGDDPDEDDIEKALSSVCKALGRRLGRVCKSLVKKYKDQISEALQNNQEAGEICTQLKMCKGAGAAPGPPRQTARKGSAGPTAGTSSGFASSQPSARPR